MSQTKTDGLSQVSITRKIGPSVRFCQINVEGISYAKSQYLSKLLKNDDIKVARNQIKN